MSASFVIGLARRLRALHPEVQGLCHVPGVHKARPFKVGNRAGDPKCSGDPAGTQSKPADGPAEEAGGIRVLRITVPPKLAALEFTVQTRLP